MNLLTLPILSDIIDLVREAVPDKDKQAEIKLKMAELQMQMTLTVLGSKTSPFIDGLVKLIYALIALAAPLGSFCITAFGMFAHWKGIPIPDMTHAMIDGAFPAWRGLRHLDKRAGLSALPAAPKAAPGAPPAPPAEPETPYGFSSAAMRWNRP